MDIYKKKYEKYKKKYLELKKLLGGKPPKNKKSKPSLPSQDTIDLSCEKKKNAQILEEFNNNFKMEYQNKLLSIINLISRALPITEDINNYSLWNCYIKEIFKNFKDKFNFLTDLDVINLLNKRFKKIKSNLDKSNLDKSNLDKSNLDKSNLDIQVYTIDKLTCEINKIIDEIIIFLSNNSQEELLLLLSDDKRVSFNFLSLDVVLQEIKEELIFMKPEIIQQFLYNQIREQSVKPIETNADEGSVLKFVLPEYSFPVKEREIYNLILSTINSKMIVASDLQLKLFSLTDKQVYIIIRNLILKFDYDIDNLQDGNGRGRDYCHFLRPFNNLKQNKKDIKLQLIINLPICIEIFHVGIVFEFLERIKFFVQKHKKLELIYKSISVEEKEIFMKKHIRIIIDLYINISKLELLNLVIVLYQKQRLLFNKQEEIYNNILLIISFISYYFDSNKILFTQQQIIINCINIIYCSIKYLL